MISQTTVEKLEKEAFRGPFLTLAALLLIIAGLATIGLAFYFWVDLSDTASEVYLASPEQRLAATSNALLGEQQASLATHDEWLGLLPWQGLALILVGVALLLWRWVAAVRLRMTVSALILPSLRSTESLEPTGHAISTFEVPLDPDREAES